VSLSHEDVLQILALLDASGFDELRLETSDYKLHLRRSAAPIAEPEPEPEPEPPSAERKPPLALVAAPPHAETRDLLDVTAPMVGVFYAAPQPGAPPFVRVGDAVSGDTVVGIVEVMKLMNAIPAGANGVVVETVARDGDLVEYGAVLLRIARAPS
jgi:acetyl-CoA carboxylase biotin carboxyl carrier protein